MKEHINQLLEDKKILLLGFGKEGRSSYQYIRANFPEKIIGIADRDIDIPAKAGELLQKGRHKLHLGENYLTNLGAYELVIKSPGVVLPPSASALPGTMITSQTRLMLQAFHTQITGITGTKGKSTTSSLLHHLLETSGINSVLVGNIGAPPFDYLDKINSQTHIVFEMSSHQLEDSILAPHTGILLNLFPEHLDRYPGIEAYFETKWKMLTAQEESDHFICSEEIPGLKEHLKGFEGRRKLYSFSSKHPVINGLYINGSQVILCQDGAESDYFEVTGQFPLKGIHNVSNAMAAILGARLAGADDDAIRSGLLTFRSLEHRLEYVGEFSGIHFYNDSIATIPEATLAAINALPETDTLILGGYDRMLDYGSMIRALMDSNVRNFIFIGAAGMRMAEGFETHRRMNKTLYRAASMEEAVEKAFILTARGRICLLSPAASSYDRFRNFEERGKVFKKLAGS